jgi:hypothetical protein
MNHPAVHIFSLSPSLTSFLCLPRTTPLPTETNGSGRWHAGSAGQRRAGSGGRRRAGGRRGNRGGRRGSRGWPAACGRAACGIWRPASCGRMAWHSRAAGSVRARAAGAVQARRAAWPAPPMAGARAVPMRHRDPVSPSAEESSERILPRPPPTCKTTMTHLFWAGQVESNTSGSGSHHQIALHLQTLTWQRRYRSKDNG